MHATVALRCALYFEEASASEEHGVPVDGKRLNGFAHGFWRKGEFQELKSIAGGGFVRTQIGRIAKAAIVLFGVIGTYLLAAQLLKLWHGQSGLSGRPDKKPPAIEAVAQDARPAQVEA